jgi:AraC-like DNA-binding protein/quercetin dioxygenase-like cupin family protein
MPQEGHVPREGHAAPAPDAPHPVYVRAFEYPQGYPGHAHRHRLAQIVYPVRGAVSVESPSGTWVVTRLTAVAIPPWQQHRVAAHGNASLRSVFVDPDVHPDLVDEMVAVHLSELLHELILEAGRHYSDLERDETGVAEGVVALIVRLLPTMPTSRTSVWLPRIDDPLLQPIEAAFETDPGDGTTAEQWAQRLGLSARHFSRVFKSDTGVRFSTWRSLHHVNHALVLLAGGAPVTRVAMDLGYSSTSSFIEMFKRHTGRTPGASTDAVIAA